MSPSVLRVMRTVVGTVIRVDNNSKFCLETEGKLMNFKSILAFVNFDI